MISNKESRTDVPPAVPALYD